MLTESANECQREECETFASTLVHGWFCKALFGFVYLGLACLAYIYITDLEEQEGLKLIHWLVALSYNIAGKWGTVFMFAVPGVVLSAASLKSAWKGRPTLFFLGKNRQPLHPHKFDAK